MVSYCCVSIQPGFRLDVLLLAPGTINWIRFKLTSLYLDLSRTPHILTFNPIPDFSYIPKALPLGLKPGFNTNCLSPQAHCLNDCFFL